MRGDGHLWLGWVWCSGLVAGRMLGRGAAIGVVCCILAARAILRGGISSVAAAIAGTLLGCLVTLWDMRRLGMLAHGWRVRGTRGLPVCRRR